MPRAAVLGSPIGHSLSPALHRAAYRELGLTDWTYDAVEVAEDQLAAFLTGLGPEWAGLSLTMPLKRVVLGLLDEVSDTVAVVGAANTVVWRDGRRLGDNTDVPGMVAALRERAPSFPGGAEVAVLGGGATAASAVAAAVRLRPRRITAYVRGPRRAEEITALAARLRHDVRIESWENGAEALTADLVIATTPVGAADHLATAVPPRPGVLFDVVYAPWPTPLAAAWTAASGVVVGGLDLLVHQAADQVRLMTGHTAPVAAMRRAGESALATR